MTDAKRTTAKPPTSAAAPATTPAAAAEKRCFVTVGTTLFDDLIRALDTPRVAQLLVRAGFTHLTIQLGKGTYAPVRLAQCCQCADAKAATAAIAAAAAAAAAATKGVATTAGAGATAAAAAEPAASYPLVLEWFDYRPSLASFVDGARLVVSHAGAGSILEALRSRGSSSSPATPTPTPTPSTALLVVVNPTLMDNHQRELARALEDAGYLTGAMTPDEAPDRLALLLDRMAHAETAAAGGGASALFKRYPNADTAAFARIVDSEFA